MKLLQSFGLRENNGFAYLSALLIWLKTYFVQRFCFVLPVKGWYQELIIFISPLSSVLVLLSLIMIFLRRGVRAAVIAASAFTSLLLLADLVYFRFYNDFITIPVLFQSDNLGDLWGSIFSLLRPLDLLIFTDTLALAVAACAMGCRAAAWGKYRIAAALVLAFMVFSTNLSMANTVRPELLERTFDRQIMVKSIGAYNYHLYDALVNAQMGSKKAFASNGDLVEIENFLRQIPKDEIDAEMFGIAKGYNVFLISMESLQSFVIGRSIEGNEITPFLNRLIKDSIYFENFYHQTGQGKTSDAEFLADTSLYPLPSGAVYFTHAQNAYDTLPKILKKLGYYTAVFHANDPSFWNRGHMYPTMGYERFFAASDYNITEQNSIGWGLKDISFFEQTTDLAKSLPEPFFAKLITLTNHYPFELTAGDRFIPEYTSRSQTLNRYIATVRYMDEALKRFFDKVKEEGLYERSIFVLYGDHYGISQKHRKAMAGLLGKEKLTPFDHAQLQRVPLIIHIPGSAGKRMKTVGGQVDLKPTVLHLLGEETVGEINFGHGLFAKNRPEFAVFRDGSFVTDRYVFTENTCYDKATGEKTDKARCEPFRELADKHLTYSDQIIYGDLLRFNPRF
ncbi:LTA synthase family protein [Paenibacillus alkalitolerans]|uniref:LTA synthase family protein n=1 Tax=Paenibacillus alkalitolerans TaxID=2799335 RepID=UPI002D7E7CB5|nr:LTA synthase family protein [Paenibacillus alkalitolerans]